MYIILKQHYRRQATSINPNKKLLLPPPPRLQKCSSRPMAQPMVYLTPVPTAMYRTYIITLGSSAVPFLRTNQPTFPQLTEQRNKNGLRNFFEPPSPEKQSDRFFQVSSDTPPPLMHALSLWRGL